MDYSAILLGFIGAVPVALVGYWKYRSAQEQHKTEIEKIRLENFYETDRKVETKFAEVQVANLKNQNEFQKRLMDSFGSMTEMIAEQQKTIGRQDDRIQELSDALEKERTRVQRFEQHYDECTTELERMKEWLRQRQIIIEKESTDS